MCVEADYDLVHHRPGHARFASTGFQVGGESGDEFELLLAFLTNTFESFLCVFSQNMRLQTCNAGKVDFARCAVSMTLDEMSYK